MTGVEEGEDDVTGDGGVGPDHAPVTLFLLHLRLHSNTYGWLMVAHGIGGIDASYGSDRTDSTKPQQETSVMAGMSGRRRWPPRGVLLGFWHVGWRIGTAYCYRRRHPRLLLRQPRGRRGIDQRRRWHIAGLEGEMRQMRCGRGGEGNVWGTLATAVGNSGPHHFHFYSCL